MKFSWITVLAFAALGTAVGSIALLNHRECAMRGSQLDLMRDQMVRRAAASSQIAAEAARMAKTVARQNSEIESLKQALNEEENTHDPLRQQIVRMTRQGDVQEKRLEDIQKELQRARQQLEDERSKEDEANTLRVKASELEEKIKALEVKSAADSLQITMLKELNEKTESRRKALESESEKRVNDVEVRLKKIARENELLKKDVLRLQESLKALNKKTVKKPEPKQPPQPEKVANPI